MNVYKEDINWYHVYILCIYGLKLHNWLIHCKYWEKIYLIYDKHISRIKSNYLPFMNVYIVYTYIFTELYVIYYNIYFISIVNIRWINSFFTQKSVFLKIFKNHKISAWKYILYLCHKYQIKYTCIFPEYTLIFFV